MASTRLNQLKKALGPEYQILVIDLEECLYRNFGNGYDLEISGINSSKRKQPVTLYLWDIREKTPKMVKITKNIERNAEDIAAAANEMYEYSEKLKSTES